MEFPWVWGWGSEGDDGGAGREGPLCRTLTRPRPRPPLCQPCGPRQLPVCAVTSSPPPIKPSRRSAPSRARHVNRALLGAADWPYFLRRDERTLCCVDLLWERAEARGRRGVQGRALLCPLDGGEAGGPEEIAGCSSPAMAAEAEQTPRAAGRVWGLPWGQSPGQLGPEMRCCWWPRLARLVRKDRAVPTHRRGSLWTPVSCGSGSHSGSTKQQELEGNAESQAPPQTQ